MSARSAVALGTGESAGIYLDNRTYHYQFSINRKKTCHRRKRILDPKLQTSHPECVPVVYPNTFTLALQECSPSSGIIMGSPDSSPASPPSPSISCSQYDINAHCDQTGHCACGRDMEWNTE